jgi:hypothetical protein
MTTKRTIRQVAVAVALLVAFLLQGTWALAGVTGGITGTVTDTSGKPVAGATIKVLSASQAASRTTDAGGHFTFLTLAPDTYSVSITKDGYAPFSQAGVTVFADNDIALTFQLQAALKQIARVTSTAAGALVKGGVGADVYSVNAASIQASSALGGGGNLNSAYSAIASVPGVNVPIGGSGWNNNAVSVRGSTSYFTGFEYDGVPVNRAFDNYNASTESNLGLQELQVYTGGGPASNSSSGTSGFINQVIKTGTYPGYGSVTGGIASDAFYHDLKVEAGGASPDRNFSYYVGLSGYNQAFRFLDNNNGAGQMGPGGIYSDYSAATDQLSYGGDGIGLPVFGALPVCNADGSTPAGALTAVNKYIPGGQPVSGAAITSACLFAFNGISALTSFIADRENVVNFHFAIPRKDGQRDDLQLLWSGSMLKTSYYGDVDDLGGPNNFMLALNGSPYNATSNYPSYTDGYVFNEPFGSLGTNPTLNPLNYYMPDSPTDRALNSQLPFDQQDAIYNDQGIVKLQYTHAIGDHAYARVFAYTFYSDWMQTGPYAALASYANYGYPFEALANNYLLSTHTSGGEFQFSDQINDKNLVQFTTNYTTANVMRDNNETNAYGALASPVGIISKGTNGQYTCWAPAGAQGGGQVPCYEELTGENLPYSLATAIGYPGPSLGPTAGSIAGAYGPDSLANYPISPQAAAAGASYYNLWDGPGYGSYNTVQPVFTNVSLSDQFRPSDKFLINAAIRYENYKYNMPDSDTDANEFYSQIVSNYVCYNPASGSVYAAPLAPGVPPPASPEYVSGACPSGYQHPNFSADSPSAYQLGYWSARVSGTYTQSPDTIWRFSAGRYIEPPISASVQYTNMSGNNVAQWANFLELGFTSPFHNIPAMTSAQYDLSLEKHVKGTDISYKITPFYNGTNGYQEQSFIGAGFVTQVPVGQFRSYGVEAAITKGDFSKNGFSGQLALTYTKAQVQYQAGLVNGQGVNQISYYNEAICQYDALTKSGMPSACGQYGISSLYTGAASQCYTPATTTAVGTATSCATAGAINNPYFNSPQQQLLSQSGWYAPEQNVALPGVNNTDLAYYDAPWVASLVLNYRKDKWAVTPSLQFVTGSSYGTPLNTIGLDPRECSAIDTSNTGLAAGTGGACAYPSLVGGGYTSFGQLYVPDWQTGTFDSPGQYHNPDLVVGNIAFSYDVSPRISLNLTLANVFHTCFGGSKEPWTAAYGPGPNICSYAPSGGVSNYQLGNGANNPGNPAAYSATANGGTNLYPWQFQSYAPTTGSYAGSIPAPFNAYFTVNIKI